MGYSGGMNVDDRRRAAALAVRRVQAEREIAFRPLCQDCRFGPVREGDPDKCEHFAHWKISPDRRLSIPVTTGEARSESGLCGPEAVLFEKPSQGRAAVRWLVRRPDIVGPIYMVGGVSAGLLIAVGIFKMAF